MTHLQKAVGYEWIVAKQDLSMHCKRCGRFYSPFLPVSVRIYSAICQTFVDDHKDCSQ